MDTGIRGIQGYNNTRDIQPTELQGYKGYRGYKKTRIRENNQMYKIGKRITKRTKKKS